MIVTTMAGRRTRRVARHVGLLEEVDVSEMLEEPDFEEKGKNNISKGKEKPRLCPS